MLNNRKWYSNSSSSISLLVSVSQAFEFPFPVFFRNCKNLQHQLVLTKWKTKKARTMMMSYKCKNTDKLEKLNWKIWKTKKKKSVEKNRKSLDKLWLETAYGLFLKRKRISSKRIFICWEIENKCYIVLDKHAFGLYFSFVWFLCF